MTKNKYHLPAFGMFATLTIIGLSALASSCATTPASYSTPGWAAGVSDGTVPYYYFPDYDMYYDAGAGQYYYLNNGAWVTSAVVPYGGVDLNDAYMVELDRNVQRPWMNNDYYARNYPPHERQQYEQVVRDHNIIPNVPQNHTVVPRAYNENTDQMIFEERAQQQQQRQQQQQQQQRQQQQQQQQQQQEQQRQQQQQQQQARGAQQSGRPGVRPQPPQRVAVHQVPMRTIAPNMPAQARGYRWGGAAKGR
ncbi:MAG TPA: hypothetical protein VFH95_13220 [Candidatus Kapabacteria bacterium]|nr:hypothetical protein [Candidatus Kapabacteria bacterium]